MDIATTSLWPCTSNPERWKVIVSQSHAGGGLFPTQRQWPLLDFVCDVEAWKPPAACPPPTSLRGRRERKESWNSHPFPAASNTSYGLFQEEEDREGVAASSPAQPQVSSPVQQPAVQAVIQPVTQPASQPAIQNVQYRRDYEL